MKEIVDYVINKCRSVLNYIVADIPPTAGYPTLLFSWVDIKAKQHYTAYSTDVLDWHHDVLHVIKPDLDLMREIMGYEDH